MAPQSYTNSPSGIIHLVMLLDVGVDVGDIGVGLLYDVNVVVVDDDGFTCWTPRLNRQRQAADVWCQPIFSSLSLIVTSPGWLSSLRVPYHRRQAHCCGGTRPPSPSSPRPPSPSSARPPSISSVQPSASSYHHWLLLLSLVLTHLIRFEVSPYSVCAVYAEPDFNMSQVEKVRLSRNLSEGRLPSASAVKVRVRDEHKIKSPKSSTKFGYV